MSAVKVDGVRSYARVRAGEDVELTARAVDRLAVRRCWQRRGDDLDVAVDCTSGHLRPGARPRPRRGARRRRSPHRAAAHPGRAVRARRRPHARAAAPRTCGVVPLDDAVARRVPAPRADRRGGGRAVVRQEARRRPARRRHARRVRAGRPLHRAARGPRRRGAADGRLRPRRVVAWQADAGAALAGGRERAVRLGAVRRHDRRVRRRPPRPPADHRPGRRARRGSWACRRWC